MMPIIIALSVFSGALIFIILALLFKFKSKSTHAEEPTVTIPLAKPRAKAFTVGGKLKPKVNDDAKAYLKEMGET